MAKKVLGWRRYARRGEPGEVVMGTILSIVVIVTGYWQWWIVALAAGTAVNVILKLVVKEETWKVP